MVFLKQDFKVSMLEIEVEEVKDEKVSMAGQRFKGEVSHCLNVKEIEWKIPRFIPLSEKTEVIFESPEFYFMGSEYQLVIRSYDDENSYDYTDDDDEDDVADDTFHTLLMIRKDQNNPSSRKIEVIYTSMYSTKDNGIDAKYKVEKKLVWDFQTSLLKLDKFKRSKLLEESTGVEKMWVHTVLCRLLSADLKKEPEKIFPMIFRDFNRLSSNLEDLLKNGEDSDIILRVQGKDFRAHRSILHTRSEVLAAAVCRKNIPDSTTKEVNIIDCDPDAFGIFLKYLYSGCTGNLSVGTALHLLKIAVRYSTMDLRSFCVDFLGSHLTADTVCEIASAAQLYGEEELMCSVQAFFNENNAEIFPKPSWVNLMKEDYCLANKLLKGMTEAK